MNAAARVISGTRKFDRCLTRLLHEDLHWLDIPQCITFKLCLLVFKCLHGFAPRYLAELTGRRRYGALQSALRHSRSTKFPSVQHDKLQPTVRAFSYAGPHAWNSLPEHLRQTTSIEFFKRSLKTFSFGPC